MNLNMSNLSNQNMLIPNQNMYNPNQNMYNPNFMMQGFPTAQPIMFPTYDFILQNDMYRDGMFNAFYLTDYLLALRNAKSAFIKQKVELLEMLTGCETKNRYSVYLRFENGVNALLFKCKEESSWFSRNCLSYNYLNFSFIKYPLIY